MSRFAGGRIFTNYADEAWQMSLFRLVLIAVMAGCVAAGPAIVRVGLGGPWRGYIIPAAAVVAAVGVLTTTQLGRPDWRNRRGSAFRLGEIVLLLLAIRVLVWLGVEGLPEPGEVPAWFLNPGRFFTGEYVFAVFVCLCAWSVAIMVTSDFLELAIQPDEVAARDSHEWGDSRSQWRVAKPLGRTEVLQGFAVRWIGIGVVLVICAAITRVDVSVSERGLVRVALGALGMRSEVAASLVVYFVAGLLLLSQGRLAVLRGRWFNQAVEIRPTLIRRWHVNSFVFIGLIALLALLLPLGSTSRLTDIVEWIIALLARVILAIGFLLGLLVAALAALITRLFGAPQGPAEEPAPLRPSAIPTQAEIAVSLPPWLGSAVLWLVIALVAGFLLVNFVRTTGLMESKLGKRLVALRLWWRARRSRVGVVVAAGFTRVRGRLRRARGGVARTKESADRGQGPLLPRDQVRRYYLRAVKEAGDEGIVRPPHKTPLEFAEDLRAEWPETEGDVRELTEAFIDARYSEREIADSDVKGAETAWRRLVRGLRGTRGRSR